MFKIEGTVVKFSKMKLLNETKPRNSLVCC